MLCVRRRSESKWRLQSVQPMRRLWRRSGCGGFSWTNTKQMQGKVSISNFEMLAFAAKLATTVPGEAMESMAAFGVVAGDGRGARDVVVSDRPRGATARSHRRRL